MDNTLSKLENTQPTEQQAARQQDIINQVRDGNYEPQLSVLEQEYMAKAMIRQKEGVVKPQVVAGREFKGTSFISKPEAIVFKVSIVHSTVHSFLWIDLFNFYFNINRTSMLEYPTLRQFFSQTFHFRLTRSNFCLWTTILRISFTFNILQPVECPQVSPLPLRLPLPLN